MIKDYNVPLNEECCRKIREAIENLDSLAEITRKETVYRVVNHLLADKPLLEQYLTEMADLFTKRRDKISFRALGASIFHSKPILSHYNKEFQIIFTHAVDKEREIQERIFIAENYMQADIHKDLWKMYKRRGDAICLISLDFSLIRCPSLCYELKYYLRHVFNCTGKINRELFVLLVAALTALIEAHPQIKCFADITEADVRSMLLFLENSCRKKDGAPLSQNYIAKSMMSTGRVVEYLMSDVRPSEIKSPKPHRNPFSIFKFHNLRDYRKSTSIIPEGVIEQINEHLDELPFIHRLLYDIFSSTGLRVKEVFFLEEDCIEGSRYDGVCQLKFTPYKVLAARRRHGVGDYHRVMITQALADKIAYHIENTATSRQANGSSYIFLTQKPGHTKSVMRPETFLDKVRNIIINHEIRDENGELWHLTNMQFRKTIAVILIENGATTAELAYWLGHMCFTTSAKYYAEVRKMKLAEFNTKFFREKFDLIISNEQLEEYTEEERKLLYVDFRLEQRRVELGYCLVKTADGRCPNRNSLYNCVNCKNLCTGKKYLSYWNELLTQQEDVIGKLMKVYHANGIRDYIDFAEYKQEFRLLKGYENIIAAINKGGAPTE